MTVGSTRFDELVQIALNREVLHTGFCKNLHIDRLIIQTGSYFPADSLALLKAHEITKDVSEDAKGSYEKHGLEKTVIKTFKIPGTHLEIQSKFYPPTR